MANSRGKNKARGRRRAHKVSAGINRMTKHPLTHVERALLGKGRVQGIKHVSCKANYKGGHGAEPYDREQAERNRALYPHLFQN